MSNRLAKYFLFALIIMLAACTQPTDIPAPTDTVPPPPTPASAPSATVTPSSNDPSLFGALSKSEIDPLAGKIQEAIFIKVMDGFVSNGSILEYQILGSEVFPSSEGGLIAEIHYNVRTADPSWLVDGGTQADDNWITDKCNRFDFVNTETEFQLKNRRTCN